MPPNQLAQDVLANIERYVLDRQVTEVLDDLGVESQSEKEFQLRGNAGMVYENGLKFGHDDALLEFIEAKALAQLDGGGANLGGKERQKKETQAQADLLGIKSANFLKIRSRIRNREHHFPEDHADPFRVTYRNEITFPNDLADFANGMGAVTAHIQSVILQRDNTRLPPYDSLWYVSMLLAFSEPTWATLLKDGSVQRLTTLSLRHVSNAAKGLDLKLRPNEVYAALLHPISLQYAEAFAISTYLLPYKLTSVSYHMQNNKK